LRRSPRAGPPRRPGARGSTGGGHSAGAGGRSGPRLAGARPRRARPGARDRAALRAGPGHGLVPHRRRALTLENLGRIATEPYFANYSPLHLLSYALDWRLAGDDPRAFHLSSNLWGGLCAAWVYGLAFYLFRRRPLAWAAGLLFALHPAHVEAIAWISSRKDLVATFLAVPCLIAWLEGRRRSSRAWYAAALVLYTLALAGKMSVVVLPAVFLLFDLLVERRRGLALVLDKLPFAVPALWFALRVMDAQPPPFRAFDLAGLSGVLAQLAWLLTGFGRQVIFRTAPLPHAGWIAVAAVLLLAPLPFLRRVPAILVALYYSTLVLLVPSQVLRFAYPVSDRYLFLPSVPFALLAAAVLFGARRPFAGARRAAGVAGLVVLAGAWAWRAEGYVHEWADPRSVWYAAVRKVDDVYAHQFLGEHDQVAAERILNALRSGGRIEARDAALLEKLGFGADAAARLEAEWARDLPRRPLTDLVIGGLLDRAWTELEAAAAFPEDRVNPELFYNRAMNLQLRGEDARAMQAFERAWQEASRHDQDRIRLPYEALSSYGMAVSAERLGDPAAALRWMRRALAERTQAGGDTRAWAAGVERLRALVGE
jgi:hypothetical protein